MDHISLKRSMFSWDRGAVTFKFCYLGFWISTARTFENECFRLRNNIFRLFCPNPIHTADLCNWLKHDRQVSTINSCFILSSPTPLKLMPPQHICAYMWQARRPPTDPSQPPRASTNQNTAWRPGDLRLCEEQWPARVGCHGNDGFGRKSGKWKIETGAVCGCSFGGALYR